MDVRLARPTDAPLALALSLDNAAHLVRSIDQPGGNQVVRTLFRAALPIGFAGRVWIAQDGESAALLEALPRRYVIGWDVTRLAVRGNRALVLAPILQASTDYLQSRGVPRIFARCSEDASEELKTVAFHALARERVLVGAAGRADPACPLPVDSRYRMPQDAWPLHQLESQVTPQLVRQMEGLTSLEWSHTIREMSEIVVERDGRIVAWVGCGVKVGHQLRQIGLLVHPEYRDVSFDLLRHSLQTAPAGQRFIARVRDYQRDVLDTFLNAGFRIEAEEILMVKHARVEAARVKSRLQVAGVPTTTIMHQRFGGAPSPPDSAARTHATGKHT